jgi:hypothetical protein
MRFNSLAFLALAYAASHTVGARRAAAQGAPAAAARPAAVDTLVPSPDSVAALPVRVQRPPARLRFELPLVDAPFSIANGLSAPSMQQSLAVTEAFYEGAHYGIQRAIGRGRLRTPLNRVATALFDYYTIAVPFGDAWLHEEFHRAGLSRRGIESYNGTYSLVLGATTISVSGIDDDDLARLKESHPTEFARIGAAGIEGEYELLARLQRNRFFHDSPASHTALAWLTKLNTIGYIMSGVDSTDDDIMQIEKLKESTDIAARDAVGHDFLAWVYDLSRPDEPYRNRGTHPSGEGIDRYVALSDLTPEERGYLERQGKLSILNLVDPTLFGVSGVTVPNAFGRGPLKLNVVLGHQLTSFGHTVNTNLFVRQGRANLFAVLHRYANAARTFTGVDVRLLDWPAQALGRTLTLSPRVSAWQQPAGQRFRAATADLGGLAALRVDYRQAGRLGAFVEVEGKTSGWVSGSVYLDRNVSVRTGVTVTFRAAGSTPHDVGARRQGSKR